MSERILANMKAQISWTDSASGERISVTGTTENVGESGALVNVDVLPTVGSDVKLRLIDEDKTIVEASTRVIRVERDPSRPLVALSVVKNFKRWKEKAVHAASEWVTRNLRLNYEGEWAN